MNTADQQPLAAPGGTGDCVTVLLPQNTTAPAHARALITKVASTLVDGHSLAHDVIQDAAQVASELTANAVRHGQPPFHLRVSRQRTSLRVEVSQSDDRSRSTHPVLRADRFGLQLVTAMSQAWGTSLDDDGLTGDGARRTVWAQIASPSSGTSPARLGSPSQG